MCPVHINETMGSIGDDPKIAKGDSIKHLKNGAFVVQFYSSLCPGPDFHTIFQVGEPFGPFTLLESSVWMAKAWVFTLQYSSEKGRVQTKPFSPSGGVTDWAVGFHTSPDRGRMAAACKPVVLLIALTNERSVVGPGCCKKRNFSHKMPLIVLWILFFLFVTQFFNLTPGGGGGV